jgi:hypothetical protein
LPDTAEKSMPEVVSELWDLIKRYAKQETLDPLKSIGRFLAFGLGAALAGSIGLVLLLVALLRALQTQTGSTFTGNLSWIPYLIVLLVGSLFALLAVSRISARK